MRISDWSSDVCSSDLHGAALGQAIGDEGIPVIEPAAKMLEEKKRRPALGAVPAIGVADTVNLDELSGGGNLGVGHNLSFPGLPATCMAGVSSVNKAGSGARKRTRLTSSH